MSSTAAKSVAKKSRKSVDLRIYYPNCYGPFSVSNLVIPFDTEASLSHVLDLGKHLTNYVNDKNNSEFNYLLSVDALAYLVCVDATQLRRFRSTSSVLDQFGIASSLKMVIDNLNWALDDCEKAFAEGDYTHVVMTAQQMMVCYSKKRLLHLSTFLELDDKEQVRIRIRRDKRSNVKVYQEVDAQHYFQLLASHELEVSTSLHFYADTLLKASKDSTTSVKQVGLNESNILLMRIFASYPQYVNEVSIFDVPYAMFVDLLADVIKSKSYIGYLLAKMPSQASRWMSERHAPKLETQRLINLLFHHFSQFKDDRDALYQAVCDWRNLVGFTAHQCGRDLLEPQ